MSVSTKILIILGTILTLGLLSFIVYKEIENSAMQKAIQDQVVAQKQLVDGIVRSQSTWATKDDLNKFITDNGVNLKAIQDDLAALGATLTTANVVTVNSQGQNKSNVASTSTTPKTQVASTSTTPASTVVTSTTVPDPFGYQANQQNLALNETFIAPAATPSATPTTTQVPIGTVGFSAWQPDPWSLNIAPRQYSVTNVIGTDDQQRNDVYNRVTITTGGKTYDVPITTSKTEQQYPTAKWSWWNPRLFLTAGGAVNLSRVPIEGSANAGAGLGIMSYGQFKTNPAISVLQVGLGYEAGTQKAAVIVNPVNFNIGGILPKGLVDNTYVGPSLQMDTGGNILAGANVSVGF